MNAPAGFMTYPGIHGCRSASYTLKPGTEPGIAWIYTPMSEHHGNIPKRGTLTMHYGASRLTLPDCTLDDVSLATAADGTQMLAFKFLDRRHRWAFGLIEGEYNVREGDAGDIKESTKKSARQLAELALLAMGERRADTSVMPLNRFPQVSWSGLPKEALEQLCEWASCRVVFSPFTNSVALRRIGAGASLPPGPIVSDDFALDSPELPDSFVFATQPVWFEMDLELEAVALDPITDKVVSIRDVSYTPVGGWEKVHPPLLAGVRARYIDDAKRDVYKLYRPVLPIKQFGHKIEDRWRILPLLDHRATLIDLDSDDNREMAESIVYGTYLDGGETGRPSKGYTRGIDGQKYRIWNRGFTTEAEQGLIRFGEPMYVLYDRAADALVVKAADPTKIESHPARLWLRVAVQVRDEKTGAFLRHFVTEKPSGRKLGSPPHFISREDVRLVRWKERKEGGTVDKDNRKAVEAAAQAYLVDEINGFRTKASGTRTYAGFLNVMVDGAISQVTWKVTDEGKAYTVVSREREDLSAALSFRQLRERQVLREMFRRYRGSGGIRG